MSANLEDWLASCRVDEQFASRIVEGHGVFLGALDETAKETGKSIAQIALNWLLQRPTVSSVLIGARNEAQLRDNLGSTGWNLTTDQVARLDVASRVTPPYPYYPYWYGPQAFLAAFDRRGPQAPSPGAAPPKLRPRRTAP
jgi:aryl-alcohol dehydrogenase-like predicted oxidoreductase